LVVCVIAEGTEKGLEHWIYQFPDTVKVLIYPTSEEGEGLLVERLQFHLNYEPNFLRILPFEPGLTVKDKGFSACRNHVLSFCRGRAVLSLDTDEYVSDWNLLFQQVEPSDKSLSSRVRGIAKFEGHSVWRLTGDSSSVVWRGRAHEALYYTNVVRPPEREFTFKVQHRKDLEKPRLDYLPLLEKDWEDAMAEKPYAAEFNRANFYFGRELYYRERFSECADVLEDYVPKDGFPSEHALAEIYLSRAYVHTGMYSHAFFAADLAYKVFPSMETLSHLVWLVSTYKQVMNNLPRTHMHDLIL
jgi:hypothetical protein